MMRIFGLGLLILLIVAGWGHANDSSYQGQGETVWPVGNNQIEMVSEKVVITYRPLEDRFYADCSFVLKNTGDSTEVTVGFPDPGNSMAEEEDRYVPTIEHFRAWIDGTEITTETKAGIPSPVFPDLIHKKVFVWKTPFQEGQTRTLRNTYSFFGIFMVPDIRGADYVLKSGKVWKGPIGEAEILFRGIEEPFFVSASPEGYVRKGNVLIWHFKHFKPKADIRVEFYGEYQRWFAVSKHLLKEKYPNPDTLFETLEWSLIIPPNMDTTVEKSFTEIWKKLKARLPEGPLKDDFTYQDCLDQGDTAQAVRRWISSLKGRCSGRWIWNPWWALSMADSFKQSLNPDTGRYVRCLKALEETFHDTTDATISRLNGWPELAKKYRSIGKYKDALRCYQLGLEHFPIRPINSVDTLNLAALLNDMGQTMLLAGDTTKAIPYLEKAMKYPRTPGGGLAASMLKRIKERTER